MNLKLGAGGGVANTANTTFTVSSLIDLNGNNLSLNTANGSGTMVLGGSIWVPGIFNRGSGKTALAASNGYTGTTTVTGGILAVRHAERLGTANGLAATGTQVTDSNAAVQLENGITVANELLSAPTGITIRMQSLGTNVWTGNITTTNGSVNLQPTTGNTLQIDGNVTLSSGFAFFSTGSGGKVILNGAASGTNFFSFGVGFGIAEVNGTILTSTTTTVSGTLSGIGTVTWSDTSSAHRQQRAA